MNLQKLAACFAAMTLVAAPISFAKAPHGHSSLRSSPGVHYTHGYVRRNGSYVHGYQATNPNGTHDNNFSTRGNVNPYTGKPGTKPRDGELR
jgi:hypothetical protein